jgi:hypothetical protein
MKNLKILNTKGLWCTKSAWKEGYITLRELTKLKKFFSKCKWLTRSLIFVVTKKWLCFKKQYKTHKFKKIYWMRSLMKLKKRYGLSFIENLQVKRALLKSRLKDKLGGGKKKNIESWPWSISVCSWSGKVFKKENNRIRSCVLNQHHQISTLTKNTSLQQDGWNSK